MDSSGHIYISENDKYVDGVVRFRYNKGTIVKGSIETLNNLKGANVSKLAVANINNEEHVFVLMNEVVLRYREGKYVTGTYYYPAGESIQNIYVNQRHLVLETADTFYFYPLDRFGVDKIISTLPSANTLISL